MIRGKAEARAFAATFLVETPAAMEMEGDAAGGRLAVALQPVPHALNCASFLSVDIFDRQFKLGIGSKHDSAGQGNVKQQSAAKRQHLNRR